MTRIGALLAVLLVLCNAGGGLFATMPSAGAQELTPISSPQASPVAQPGETLPGNPTIRLVKVTGGLADPIAVAAPHDGTGRLFVVERVGRIRIIDKAGKLLPAPFLDLTPNAAGTGVVSNYIEQGMLGLAFHPDYATNGRFYVAFTDLQTNGDLLVIEFHVSADDPNRAARSDDPYAWGGRILLDVDQPYVDHNGGTLRFGPDGYLYVALGDGGGMRGDPLDRAQSRFSLLGKLLRIDVDGGLGDDGTRVRPYGIPPDNPFAGCGQLDNPFPPAEPDCVSVQAGGEPYDSMVRQEIWASGLRNPWQFSFDSKTGDLYIPDVGQATWEEINFQPAGNRGGQNYGWDWMEGTHCFPEDRVECPQVGVLPVAEYKHGQDGCSVVGIGVYRGEEFPSLDGIYFSADWCSGKVWGLKWDEAGTWAYQELLDTELLVTGAGSDEAGNLYLTACRCDVDPRYDPFKNPRGTVWRLIAADRVADAATTTAPL
jgi:glucose/arabinose dehydrogenase